MLAAAHAVSLVHRDLKPRNIMLGPDGTVTVLDFGVAALLDPELTTLTAAGETLGSPAYMAPEQALHGTVGPPSDLYSLGCVLHELLAGEQPFSAEVPYALMHKHVEQAPQPLRELRAEVPAAVELLVLDLLTKEPEQRPSAPALMDPTRPYRFPLDPRQFVAIRSHAEVTPQVQADVDGARRHAQRLIHQGRFTQAAEILAEAVAAQTRHGGDAEQMRELRLDLASALILGGDYRPLPEYRTLIAELTQARGPVDEIVLAATRPRSAPPRPAMSAQRYATSAACSPTRNGFSGLTTTRCSSFVVRSGSSKHRPETCPQRAGRCAY